MNLFKGENVMTSQLKDIFQKEYEKLNQKQKEAVDTVNGPVMVIAGPGTGKTQILSRRVANIILNHHTNPEAIVCLTYTEAGASEMLDRLEGFIGEEGRKVRVSTIHAFCSALILDNAELFGNQPKVISAASQYELLKEIMDEHIKEDNILFKNSGERYSSKEQLLELYSKMKRENLGEEDIENEIEEYFKTIELSVEGDELYKKFKYARKYKGNLPGDLKPDFEKEKQKFEKLKAGVKVVEQYKEKILENNYFDFDDMVLWTIEKLEEVDSFQKEVSNTIQYLFVDEFQDTSVVQNRLIDLLVKGKENPNIFVVGDDDQSIYRFQGVSASNIVDFDKKYHPTKVVLEENYRSSQAIIDAAKELIRLNPREEKALFAAGENKDYENKVPIIKGYVNPIEEMYGVASEIKQLIESGVTPNQIGVIYGRNSYGQAFANLLRQQGIFVKVKETRNLFNEPFFKKLLTILKYTCKPGRDVWEFRKILYMDLFDVTPSEIAEIRNLNIDEGIPNKKIESIYKKLEKIRFQVVNAKKYISPMFILSEIIKKLGIDVYIMNSPQKYHFVSIINELYKLMLAECMLHSGLTMLGFMAKLSGLQEMKIAIPIEDISGSPVNCVQLMTAHGSKGLEFEHVFMMKCNDGKTKNDRWPGAENKSGSFTYPPTLKGKEVNEEELKSEEERRLFYVAMTRAKKVLHLSYSTALPKTHFLNDIVTLSEEVFVDKLSEECELGENVTVDPFDTELLAEIIDEFSLSVSSLNAFLKCPLSFYFGKALRVSSETNEVMVFGSMIHETLEKIFIASDGSDSSELTLKNVIPLEEAKEIFIKIFEEKSWQFQTERAKRDDRSRGLAILENLYREPDYLKPGIIAVEKNIKDIQLGDLVNIQLDLSEITDMKLNGKIDRIEIDENIIRLIDYKTGNADNALKKLEGPSEDEPLGGDYWRQAVFYYILLMNSDIEVGDKKIVVKYIFVENPKEEKGFSETPDYEISESEVESLMAQIKDVFIQLKNGEFTSGCGCIERDSKIFPCDFCLQVKSNFELKFGNLDETEFATYQKSRQNYRSLSVSKLNHFLQCPKSLYFDDVLQLTTPARLSGPKKEHQAKETAKHAPTGPVFGTVMHGTLEKIYKENLSLNQALEYHDELLHAHQDEIIETMPADQLKTYGHKLLKNLYEKYIPYSIKGDQVLLEKEIHVRLEDNYFINGIVDKLEFEDDVIRVVDYKTGSSIRGVEELEYGHDYWRQAVYYNILLLNTPDIDTTNKKIETQYIFLDDNQAKDGFSIHTLQISDEDIQVVLQQIKEFWTRVNDADFVQGCEKEECDYCRLGKLVEFNQLKELVQQRK